MQIVIVLAILTGFAVAESLPQQPVDDPFLRLMAILGVMFLVISAAAMSSLYCTIRLKKQLDTHSSVYDTLSRFRKIHTLVWFGGICVISYGLGWSQLVRYNWELNDIFLMDDILIAAPAVLSLLASWATFYDVDRSAMLLAAKNLSKETDDFWSRAQYLWFEFKHNFMLCLLPLFFVLGINDGLELLFPDGLSEEVTVLLMMVPMILLIVGFPLVLKYFWGSGPLPKGELRESLVEISKTYSLRISDILVWNTENRIANAAVVGFIPKTRFVFLTDHLLKTFSKEQLIAVLGHELGHVKRHHLWIRLALIGLPFSVAGLIYSSFPEVIEELNLLFMGYGIPIAGQHSLLVLLIVAIYIPMIFSRISRLLEVEADLFACSVLANLPSAKPKEALDENGELKQNIEATRSFIDSLNLISSINGIPHDEQSWQHYSIAHRTYLLQKFALEPDQKQLFLRDLKILVYPLVAISVCSMILGLGSLFIQS